MIILGIDTSFDDTAAAVTNGNVVCSNVFSTQLTAYKQWGGVVPRLARESHINNIDAVIKTAMSRAKVTWENIDAIAVTRGPGLSITLEIGIAKAKELARLHSKPLIAVNHLEGHLLSFMALPKTNSKFPACISYAESIAGRQFSNTIADKFPMLGVIVSGGNTMFVLISEIGKYEILGRTQDDAMGEAFDKVGRMLGLGYPAGALVETLAKDGTPGKVIFPVPMRQTKSGDTSFSGLKTAATRIIEPLKAANDGTLTKSQICDIALGFQTACVTHLMEKLEFVLNQTPVNTLVLGGGVASNQALRRALRLKAKEHGIPFLLPYTKKLCTDNAAMIALAGNYKALRSEFESDIELLDRDPNLKLA